MSCFCVVCLFVCVCVCTFFRDAVFALSLPYIDAFSPDFQQ